MTSVEGSTTKRITSTPEQERGVSFSPDGKSLVYTSERNGRLGIYETRKTRDEELYFYASTVLKETPLIADTHQNAQAVYSPDGKELAYVEDRSTLKIYTFETKLSRVLLTAKELDEGEQYFQWSPDSKWILFDYSVPGIAAGEVGLIRADGKSPAINLTQSGFNDSRARWIMDGKAMLWISNRDGLQEIGGAPV